eukprot:TRINITY_DN7978_c0_g1_i1.p1 TRINITY_DN7978_c0_g1~~TRINITY_DN7978_c0_g1_i1.p1  ORF type:complete len:734 (+),score=160.91 TRINITY_DN7978_c0_g1_i1:58-2259(+)
MAADPDKRPDGKDAVAAATMKRVHKGAPLPDNEKERVQFLQGLHVLDTVAEEAFDGICRMLADTFDVPIALVSLVDSERQWFKSKVGLLDSQTPRDMAFCAHLLVPDSPEMLLVPDATQDSRFCQNPLVIGEPHIRFYCGAPIILKNYRLGSLCMIDLKPRYDMSKQIAMLLVNLADLVAGLLAKEKNQSDRYAMVENASMLIDTTSNELAIEYMNKRAVHLMQKHGLAGRVAGLSGCVNFEDPMMDTGRGAPFMQRGTFGPEKIPVSTFFYPVAQQLMGQSNATTTCIPCSSAESSPIKDKDEKNLWFAILRFPSETRGEVTSPIGGSTFASKSSLNTIFSGGSAIEAIERVADVDAVKAFPGICAVVLTSQMCGACTRFQEIFAMVSQMTEQIRFFSISLDHYPELAQNFVSGALFLPTVVFQKKGERLEQWAGKEYRDFFETVAVIVEKEGGDPAPFLAPKLAQTLTYPGSPTADSVIPEKDISALEAERQYSRTLEQMLTGSVAAHMKEVRSEIQVEKARVELLERERKTRARNQRGQKANHVPQFDPISENDQQTTEVVERGELPPYSFRGTIAELLGPVFANRLVLIFGGKRAAGLEKGMRAKGIDATYLRWSERKKPIPTHGRRGRNMAIVDVVDQLAPSEGKACFEQASDALQEDGAYALISTDFEMLDVVAMLGHHYGWDYTAGMGSRQDYGVLILRKGPNSDELLYDSYVKDRNTAEPAGGQG